MPECRDAVRCGSRSIPDRVAVPPEADSFSTSDTTSNLSSADFQPDAVYGDEGDDWIFDRDGSKDYLNGGPGSDKAQRDLLDTLVSVEGNIP